MRVRDDKDSNPRPMPAWDAVSKDRGDGLVETETDHYK